MDEVQMSAGIGAMIVQIASARGADAAALQARAGFDVAWAVDPDLRIPLAMEEALWDEAARLTKDDLFGVHAAEMVRPGAFGVMDYAVRTAPTLRVSLERLIRYNRLVHDAAVFSLVPREGRVRIEHAFRETTAVQCRQSAEFTIAAVVTLANQITSRPLEVRAVEFRHRAPASEATLQGLARFFGVEPRFSSTVNALEIDAGALDRPVPAADPLLWRVMERHAEALLAARPERQSTASERVRRLLAGMLGEGDATLTGVARRLRMSERSLQRRLSDEGTTFDELLDELRRELALRYLADPKLAIGEVAYLLGYSEPSPFHRAFKRWTGVTPSEARKRAA